jgi:molybdopterin converting factor subunit 1
MREVVRRYGVNAIVLNNRYREIPPADYWAPRPEWFAAARARLDGDGAQPIAPRSLQVQYFALLREQAGRSAETVTSSARNARELYEELRAARGLKLRPEQLRVAVNDEFAEWTQPLAAGDTVVFLPPVAGG